MGVCMTRNHATADCNYGIIAIIIIYVDRPTSRHAGVRTYIVGIINISNLFYHVIACIFNKRIYFCCVLHYDNFPTPFLEVTLFMSVSEKLKTRMDKIGNGEISQRVNTQPAEQTASKNVVRWRSNVNRMPPTPPQMKALVIQSVGRRPRGRPCNQHTEMVQGDGDPDERS